MRNADRCLRHTLACPVMTAHKSGGYRHALSQPGVASFTAAGAVARLPLAMTALAIVLLVSNETGSYAYAGALSATFAVTAGLAGIVTSRWADRSGQATVLRILAPVHGLLLTLFTLLVLTVNAPVLEFATIVAAGAVSPAIGSYVRARWSHVSQGPDMLRVGFAWESIIDELIFTVGPVLTTVLAFRLGFGVPVIVSAALVVCGSVLLSFGKRSTPPAHPGPAEHAASWFAVTRTPGIKSLVVAALGMGTLFGSLDVGVVAFTQERAQGAVSGVVLAGFAVSSMIVGIIYGGRRWPGDISRHAQIVTVALVVSSAGFLVVDSTLGLAVIAFTTGACVAPVLIAIFSLTQRLVPPANLTEGLTWTNSGLAAGFAFGSASAGWLVDSWGSARAGFIMSVAGSLAALIIAWTRRRVLQGNTDSPVEPDALPVVTWNDDPLPGPHPGGGPPARDLP